MTIQLPLFLPTPDRPAWHRQPAARCEVSGTRTLKHLLFSAMNRKTLAFKAAMFVPVVALFAASPASAVHSSIDLRLKCVSVDNSSNISNDLQHARVEVEGIAMSAATTDANGMASLPTSSNNTVKLIIRYDSTAPGVDSKGTPLRTPVQVMYDRHNPRSESVEVQGTESSGVLQLGDVEVKSLDCDLFNSAVAAVKSFYSVFDAGIPAREVRVKRWDAMKVGGPHTYYDYLVFPTVTQDQRPSFASRRCVVFHEFGHLLRFALDGDKNHFDADVLAYGYAREHGGPQLANVHYSFNEGWADYWERQFGPSCGEGAVPDAKYRDWNENAVAKRLLALDDNVGAGHRLMLQTLKANPGHIHSLHDFEVALRALTPSAPVPPAVGACPPGFTVDIVPTCRRDESMPRPSRVRGAGSPMTCAPGMEKNGALCYPQCPAGMSGNGPVCWGNCPSGYRNDGATCFRDASIISADNSACPVYDKCGLTFSKGCSKCPAGYSNDGCTCRINPHAQARPSSSRGAGIPLNACPSGQEQSGALCYPACPGGFEGKGPVCWGQCPPDTHNSGATCDTLILVQ